MFILWLVICDFLWCLYLKMSCFIQNELGSWWCVIQDVENWWCYLRTNFYLSNVFEVLDISELLISKTLKNCKQLIKTFKWNWNWSKVSVKQLWSFFLKPSKLNPRCCKRRALKLHKSASQWPCSLWQATHRKKKPSGRKRVLEKLHEDRKGGERRKGKMLDPHDAWPFLSLRVLL